jgi:glycosyltransferase involved in cell wall biosynthesis
VQSVSVIIPAHDAERTLGDTLAALAEQDFDGHREIIVVDDGSRDRTSEVAAESESEATVIRAAAGGPGPARNLGAKHARGEALAFTDADCVPTSSWLTEGLAGLRDAELVQGSVRPDPSVLPRPFDRTVWVTGELGLYECASLFVRRDLFERLGGFEDWLAPRLGKPLAEDVWFGWRARRSGAAMAFRPEALVHHSVFRRGPWEYVAERSRRLYFPAIVARVPELRDSFLYRRWFMSRDSAAFDAAVGAALVAALADSAWPLIATAPYAFLLGSRSVPWRRHAPKVAAVELAADAIGFAATALGSIKARTLVL